MEITVRVGQGNTRRKSKFILKFYIVGICGNIPESEDASRRPLSGVPGLAGPVGSSAMRIKTLPKKNKNALKN